MNKYLENGKTPEWMTKGRTSLILTEEKEGLGRLRAFLSCGRFSQEYWQRKFMDIWKERNFFQINRETAEDRVAEAKIS